MTTKEFNSIHYSGVIESTDRPLVRIVSAENDAVFAFRLMTREDVSRFVGFLNENQIEPPHVRDCFCDFLYELYAG